MEDKLNPSIVGAFVLLLGAALIGGVLWLSAGLGGKQDYWHYQSIVGESVAGLNIDAPVKFLGVDVGKVRTIAIDRSNSRQVHLGLLIAQGTPVKQDSEAVLKTQGLTGIVYVELSGGSPGSPPLVPTPENQVPMIRSKPSLSTRLENVLGTVLTSLDQMSGKLNSVFDDDNRAALKSILADTAVLTRTLAAQQGAITATITDAARTAHATAQASTQLEPLLARITAAADAVDRMGARVEVASNETTATMKSAASGVHQVRSETLPEISRLVGEMNQLATSLRGLSQQTQSNPSSLLVGAPQRAPGPGEKAAP